MKVNSLLFVSLAQAAVLPTVSNQHVKRQSLQGQLDKLTGAVDFLPEMKPAKTVEMKPVSSHTGAKRMKIYYGPFNFKPAKKGETPGGHGTGAMGGMSHGRRDGPTTPPPAKGGQQPDLALDPNSNSWNNRVTGIPTDVTLLYQSSGFEFLDGRETTLQDGLYNHHLAYVSTKKLVPNIVSCPGAAPPTGKIPAVVMGSAAEKNGTVYTTPDYKFDSGFYIPKDDKILVTGEIVNYSNEVKTVFAVSDFEYVPGKLPKDISTQIINVLECDGNQLGLRPKQGEKVFTAKSKPMTVLREGWFVNGRGHMHDGGASILLRLNGKVICSSDAIYGGASGTRKGDDGKVWETMSGVTECFGPIAVKKGDTLIVEAKYDLEKHPAREHADAKDGMAEEMGLLNFGFAYVSV